jgi:hypothetical protein
LVGKWVLSKVTQNALVEGCEGVEFGFGEQTNEMPPDVLDVQGCGILDGATSGGRKADQYTARIGGVEGAGDLMGSSDFSGER